MSLSDFPIQWRLGFHFAYQIESSYLLSLSVFNKQSLSGKTMDPTLVPGTRFESQFQICVYEHAILHIYISFFFFQQFLDRLFINVDQCPYFE